MKELSIIQGKLNAPKSQYNSFGKYRYRSCEDILAAVKPLLVDTGCTITLSDELVMVGERYYVRATATFTNPAGSTISVKGFAREEESKKGMDGSQVTGAASSYARKYALNGLLAIDDTKDSDYTNTRPDDVNMSNAKAQVIASVLNGLEEQIRSEISAAKTKDALVGIYNRNEQLQSNPTFLDMLSARRKELGI